MRKPLVLIITAVTSLLASAAVAQNSAHPILTLQQAENQALQNSPQLKAAEQDVVAATEQSDAQHSTLLPKLSLEASYRYLSVIPNIPISGTPVPFGSNNAYSVGPMISYTLWDQGGRNRLYNSYKSLAKSRTSDQDNVMRKVVLNTRTAYTQTQLAKQELQLVNESLALSRKQSQDIRARYRTGTASELDSLSAEREVSAYELRQAQGKADYQGAWIELQYWTGDLGSATPLDLQGLTQTAENSSTTQLAPPDITHPLLRSQTLLMESIEYAASSQSSQHWPLIQVQFKSSWDYPNGPIQEQIFQNTFNAAFSLPILDWGRVSSLSSQKRAEALSIEHHKAQTQLDLNRDWQKGQSLLTSLYDQKVSAHKNTQQSKRLADLDYLSYRAGRVTLLDVQAANLKMLEAQVQEARIDARTLNQRYQLQYLSGSAAQ